MALEIALTAGIGLLVARAAFAKGRLRQNLAIMARYRPRHILAVLAAGTVVIATAAGLRAASPVFGLNPVLWIISKVFHEGSGQGQGSLIFTGLRWKWYAVVFLPVLALALPRLAQIEEEQYRARTRNWADGALRSLRFGLAHLVMLIPLGASLALTWAGLLFTWAYFRGVRSVPALPPADGLPPGITRLRAGLHAQMARRAGVRQSTVYHAAFNTVLVTVLFVLLLVTF